MTLQYRWKGAQKMNLKEYRVKTPHLTQQKLADILGVSRSTVAMWENGKNEPDNVMLTRIAEYFHITTDELLGHSTKAQNDSSPVSILDKKKQLIVSKIGLMNDNQASLVLAYIDGVIDESKKHTNQ